MGQVPQGPSREPHDESPSQTRVVTLRFGIAAGPLPAPCLSVGAQTRRVIRSDEQRMRAHREPAAHQQTQKLRPNH